LHRASWAAHLRKTS